MAELSEPAGRIRQLAVDLVQTPDGRVRVEDYLTALAAAAGEAVLAAAGFDVERHTLPPGSAVFFEPVNALLTGDPLPASGAVEGTVWFVLASLDIDLPAPESLYRHVAGTVDEADWGSVSTTVAPDHKPQVMPLRASYELRSPIIAVQQSVGVTTQQRHILVATALAQAIDQTRSAIDPETAAQLSCEVLFAMAKTAPMTDAAFAEGQA